jgi:hypothetical protein
MLMELDGRPNGYMLCDLVVHTFEFLQLIMPKQISMLMDIAIYLIIDG